MPSNTTSWLGWRRRSRPSPITFAVSSVTSPAAVSTVLPSMLTRRPRRASAGRRRRCRAASRARPSTRCGPTAPRPPGRDRCARPAGPGRRPGRRPVPRRDRRAAPGRPAPTDAPLATNARCDAWSSSSDATVDRATRRSRPGDHRHPRPLDHPDDLVHVDVDRAARVDLQHHHRAVLVVGRLEGVLHQGRGRRIEEPLDLHHRDAPLASPGSAAPAPGRTESRPPRTSTSPASRRATRRPATRGARGAAVACEAWSSRSSAPPPGS